MLNLLTGGSEILGHLKNKQNTMDCTQYKVPFGALTIIESVVNFVAYIKTYTGRAIGMTNETTGGHVS